MVTTEERTNVMTKGERHCCDNSAVQFIPHLGDGIRKRHSEQRD